MSQLPWRSTIRFLLQRVKSADGDPCIWWSLDSSWRSGNSWWPDRARAAPDRMCYSSFAPYLACARKRPKVLTSNLSSDGGHHPLRGCLYPSSALTADPVKNGREVLLRSGLSSTCWKYFGFLQSRQPAWRRVSCCCVYTRCSRASSFPESWKCVGKR